MSLVIRPPDVDDADQLGRLHVRAWQGAYAGGLMPDEYLESLTYADRSAFWRKTLAESPRPRSSRLVATVDEVVIGFALIGPANSEEGGTVGELYAINVDPDHWGLGVGSTLIQAGCTALSGHGFSTAVLWVHPGNERSLRFYAKVGWIPDGVERREEILGVEVPETRLSLVLNIDDDLE